MKTKLSLPITSLQSKKGFTIIEFMIATALFSVVLLVFSAVFTMIGKLFYKGYITSKTQEASRDLMYELSRNVQFSSGAITTGPNFLCIGGADYTITLTPYSGQVLQQVVAVWRIQARQRSYQPTCA